VRFTANVLIVVIAIVAVGEVYSQAPPDSATYRVEFGGVQNSVRVLDSDGRASWQLPEAVVDSLKLLPGQRVADIGAGTGYFNELLAEAVGPGGKVYAQEIRPQLVEYIRQRAISEGTPQVEAILGQPDDPCLPDSLDLVFLCNTYRYIDGRRAYISLVRRHLVDSGRLVVVDFRRYPADTTERRILPGRVIDELESSGYELIRDLSFLPTQFFLEFELRDD